MDEYKDHLSKGDQLEEYEPDVNHLWIGGEGQLLHHADEDGRHHQHIGQVHGEGGLKVDWLKEGGGKADHQKKEGGEVGGHHLAHDLPLQDNPHRYTSLRHIIL